MTDSDQKWTRDIGRYVVGFVFGDNNQVLLIRKNRPEKQKGLLNGIGGKIEVNENPSDAMVREAFEEAGLESYPNSWLLFHANLEQSKNKLFFFVTRHHGSLRELKAKTDEELETWTYEIDGSGNFLGLRHFDRARPMYNLCYLIPMAYSYLTWPEHRYYIPME